MFFIKNNLEKNERTQQTQVKAIYFEIKVSIMNTAESREATLHNSYTAFQSYT